MTPNNEGVYCCTKLRKCVTLNITLCNVPNIAGDCYSKENDFYRHLTAQLRQSTTMLRTCKYRSRKQSTFKLNQEFGIVKKRSNAFDQLISVAHQAFFSTRSIMNVQDKQGYTLNIHDSHIQCFLLDIKSTFRRHLPKSTCHERTIRISISKIVG